MNITIDNMGPTQDKYLKGSQRPPWLTEKGLFDVLAVLFPEKEIIHEPKLKLKGLSFKPDYLIEEEKLIVEFQGFRHFTDSITIYRDSCKKEVSEKSGYQYIEIPYFVQLTQNVCFFLFRKKIDLSKGFPHGFVHPLSGNLGNFCNAGLLKTKEILKNFPTEVKTSVFRSLLKRSEIKGIPERILNPLVTVV